MTDLKRIYQSDLPSRAIAVYLYLRGRANREGVCWPAVPTMARELRVSESTVRRGVRDLEKAGFLSVEERFRWNKADSSNLYVLVCIFRPSESKETVGVSPPSREKQVQVHGRESTGVFFWKEMAKERFAKRSSACHLFRLESFSFAHGVISIDEDLVGTVLNPVQHSIC